MAITTTTTLSEPLPGPLAAAVTALAARAAQADGVAPLSEDAELALTGSGRGHVVTTEGDDLIGYASIDAPTSSAPAVELVVDPGRRRAGVGSALLTAAREAVEADPVFWAHGFLDPAQGFAKAHTLSVRRELWRMSIDAGHLAASPGVPADPAEVALPEGFAVRTWQDGDAAAWLAVNRAAFADHPEQGRITEADLRARTEQNWFDPEGFFLVEDVRGAAPALAAFHWTKVEDGVGEVYVVGVDPDHQGHGLGRVATRLGLAHLRRVGVPRVDLYVDGDNAAAIATYRAQGFDRFALDVQLG